MTSAISKAKFILLFISVIFIAHTLANNSDEVDEVVKNEFLAWRERVHEARLSARTNGSPQSSNDTGFHSIENQRKRVHEARLSARTNGSLQSSNDTGFYSNVTGFQKPQYSLKDVNNDNWGGAAQLNPPSGTFTYVTALWTVTDVQVPEGASGQGKWGISVWVGIDGIQGSACPNTVLQAGTFSVVITDENGDITTKAALVWYEWYPSSPVYLATPFRPGDLIFVYIIANSPTHARAVFINPDTNYTTWVDFQSPNSPATDICGQTAQWIVQPAASIQLADFGTVLMNACAAHTTEDDTINLVGARTLLMDIDGIIKGSPHIEGSDELYVLFVPP